MTKEQVELLIDSVGSEVIESLQDSEMSVVKDDLKWAFNFDEITLAEVEDD